MLRLLQAIATGFIVFHISAQVIAAEPSDGDVRKEAWQARLNGVTYSLPEDYLGFMRSIRYYSADGQIHVVFDRKSPSSLDFKFVRNGRETLALRGHHNSSFTTYENTLYFAAYPDDSTGCTIIAYDLDSGRKLWSTELHQSKPAGHSLYRNMVGLRLSDKGEAEGEIAGAALVVTGLESFCHYVEVLDRKTGDSIAIKEYRKGFGLPPGGGGFGGRPKKSTQRQGQGNE